MTDPIVIAALIQPRDAFVIGALLLGITILLATLRRRQRRRSVERPIERDRFAEIRQKQAARDDMQELMLQLEELSRRIGAQIDTRFQKLEAVIADADDRIERLEAAVRAARGVPALDVTVGDADAPPAPQRPVEPKPLQNRAKSSAPRAASPESGDPQRTRIHRLADEGKSPVEIARITGVKPGEVELILALRDGAGGR